MAISRILSTGFELDEFTTGLYGYEVQYASFSGRVRMSGVSRTGDHSLYVDSNQYAIFNWSGLITQLQLQRVIYFGGCQLLVSRFHNLTRSTIE